METCVFAAALWAALPAVLQRGITALAAGSYVLLCVTVALGAYLARRRGR